MIVGLVICRHVGPTLDARAKPCHCPFGLLLMFCLYGAKDVICKVRCCCHFSCFRSGSLVITQGPVLIALV